MASRNRRKSLNSREVSLQATCRGGMISSLTEITAEAQPAARGSGSAGRSVADQSRAARGRLG